jgi:acetoin utilization deacetylase AcuC-like enzyme
MTTLLYTHPACLEHDPGQYHPESPFRLRAVLEALEGPDFARLERREAPEAELEDLARVHPRGFVERLLAAVPQSGHAGIDADTVMSPARSMPSSQGKPTMRSAPCARPGTTPSPAARWGSACSTTSPSGR